MNLRAGRLRHRVILQEFVETRDSNGNRGEKQWVDIAKLWAGIEPLSGRELIAAASIASKVATRIVIRSRDGIYPNRRFFHRAKNRAYDILAPVEDRDSGNEYITVSCAAGANAG